MVNSTAGAEPTLRRIAFIGAGQMGGRVARLLVRAGYELTVCDPDPVVQQQFASEGVAIARDPCGCAAADVVIIFVMNGPQATQVTLGPRGLLAGVSAASPPRVIVMSTIGPEDVRRMAAELATKGVRTVDAAVTGGLTLAEEGRLLLLVGGDPADVDHVQPLLELMGRKSIRCGPLGAGLTAKILNNMLGTSNLYLMQECYRLGLAYGLQPQNVAAILEEGAGQNFWTRDPHDTVMQMDLLSRQLQYFTTVLTASAKDWRLAVQLADQVGMDLPFLKAMIGAVSDADGPALQAQWRRFVTHQPE
jgi:3-hydroxyisobutyrate dehydrogenase-like beta-hydroxyacid dehydrogenase